MSGATVTSGQTVSAKQQIGYVGTEGNSTGCHRTSNYTQMDRHPPTHFPGSQASA